MPFYPDPVDLNTLHRRAAGSDETTCSFDDTDIKALLVTGNGRSGSHYHSTLKESYSIGNEVGGGPAGNYGYSNGVTDLDDISSLVISQQIYDGWNVEELVWVNTNPGQLVLRYKDAGSSTVSASNSGWEALKVGDTYFYRNEGAYSTPSGDMTWVWDTSNPYPTDGSDTTIRLG